MGCYDSRHKNAGSSIPEALYKYQSFIKADGTANSHWDGNMEGQFHMSLGCEFEDRNDCKPDFSKNSVSKYIDDFLRSSNTDSNVRVEISEKLMQPLTDKYLYSVISNYQNMRIGCFTDSSDNEKMWKKYACDKTGYCIAYDTSKKQTISIIYTTRIIFYSFL